MSNELARLFKKHDLQDDENKVRVRLRKKLAEKAANFQFAFSISPDDEDDADEDQTEEVDIPKEGEVITQPENEASEGRHSHRSHLEAPDVVKKETLPWEAISMTQDGKEVPCPEATDTDSPPSFNPDLLEEVNADKGEARNSSRESVIDVSRKESAKSARFSSPSISDSTREEEKETIPVSDLAKAAAAAAARRRASQKAKSRKASKAPPRSVSIAKKELTKPRKIQPSVKFESKPSQGTVTGHRRSSSSKSIRNDADASSNPTPFTFGFDLNVN